MSGLGAFAGSLFSSALGYSSAEQNRSFQRSMSNTQYQRSMADMKKAGLNPILGAAKGGVGAGTPGGSSMGAVENPVTSAMGAMKIASEIKNIEAQTEYIGNKTDISEPISQLAAVLAEYIKPGASSAKQSVDKVYRNVEEIKKVPSSALKVLQALSEKARSTVVDRVSRKAQQVGHTYKSWWQKLTEETKGLFNSAKTWFGRGK